MSAPAPADYLEPYCDAVDQHGCDFQVTLWANRKTQELRFSVFTQMVYLAGKRILDAGCSRGDLAAYLLDREIHYSRFIGVDGLQRVIDYAAGRDLLNSEFHCGDFVADPGLLTIGGPQVITISGSLNTMDDPTALSVLQHAWEATGKSLIFNFLSDRCSGNAPAQAYPARRFPTMKLLDWALSQTADVQFRQDYFPNGHDATILMHKPG